MAVSVTVDEVQPSSSATLMPCQETIPYGLHVRRDGEKAMSIDPDPKKARVRNHNHGHSFSVPCKVWSDSLGPWRGHEELTEMCAHGARSAFPAGCGCDDIFGSGLTDYKNEIQAAEAFLLEERYLVSVQRVFVFFEILRPIKHRF